MGDATRRDLDINSIDRTHVGHMSGRFFLVPNRIHQYHGSLEYHQRSDVDSRVRLVPGFNLYKRYVLLQRRISLTQSLLIKHFIMLSITYTIRQLVHNGKRLSSEFST